MRCIKMLKIHDPYASAMRGEEVFNTTQCRNHAFGTHDFCLSCLKQKVWKSQSRICAVRACDQEIENEVDGWLLYPQKEYGKSVYDRMHVVCEYCHKRYVREAKKQLILPKMYWITHERLNEIQAEINDWHTYTFENTGQVPCKPDTQQKLFSIYRRERRQFRKSPDYDKHADMVAMSKKAGRCEDCRCEAGRDQLLTANPTKYGEADMLCWVCRENRLWALGVHPGVRRGGGLLKRMARFFKKIDSYRKVVPVTLEEEVELMEAISYLTPAVSSSSPLYKQQLRTRRRLFVIEWWYSSECPSCREVKEESQWVVDWEKDLAGCKSCHMNGWSLPFKRYVIPFGLAFD